MGVNFLALLRFLKLAVYLFASRQVILHDVCLFEE